MKEVSTNNSDQSIKKNIIQNLYQNSSTRLMLTIFLVIILITTFFITFGYFNQLKIYEQKESEKLKALATSLAINMDGDLHEELMKAKSNKDDILKVQDDRRYRDLNHYLQKAHKENGLKDILYTIVFDEKNNTFEYGVRSDQMVYFRHQYEWFPEVLLKNKETGGVIEPYSTENGEWISAFHPIRNSKGEVVALLEADVKFSDFKKEVFRHYNKQAMISFFVIALLAYFLFRYARNILDQEQQIKKQITEQKEEIEQKNKDVTDSINYAEKIQKALMPSDAYIKSYLPESFVFFRPRDVVSGDFYWFHEIHGKCLFMAADCTGHGIPGALMSMIGCTNLEAILDKMCSWDPATILTELDRAVTNILTDEGSQQQRKDGMDVSLVCIDPKENKISFSGAFRPLIRINGEEIDEIKGDRFPIGGGNSYQKSDFQTQDIDIKEGDKFYMFSDGFPDQFGGTRDKKYMTKKFKRFLAANQNLSMDIQEKRLDEELYKWKGDSEQVDDILVIGFKV